jgi:hypothetical protein
VFWAIYRCVRGVETGRHLLASKRAVTAAVSSSQREKRGGDCGRKKTDQWVPRVGERKREGGIPVRDCLLLGRGLFSRLGRKASPGVQFVFFFSFFFSVF